MATSDRVQLAPSKVSLTRNINTSFSSTSVQQGERQGALIGGIEHIRRQAKMFMKRSLSCALAMTLIASALTTSFSSTAQAASRQDRAGAAIAVGVIGLAAGALIASTAADAQSVSVTHRYIGPPPPPPHRVPRRYFRPPPPPAPTYVPVRAASRFQPWTPAWYRYCSNRYRSFNPNTGYFLAYSGEYRFCR